jgi:hypothetical protein
MSRKKIINWILSSVGVLSIAVSLTFLITPAYAAFGCSATASGCAAGGAASCDCPDGGSCSSGAGWVVCSCNDTGQSSAGQCELIVP